ncbi:MAG TPA: PDZ domain-containing protein [Capsulimonadaceae bacterium]|jgi:membrane-associated protease RseP (regulator of RpoE activity)
MVVVVLAVCALIAVIFGKQAGQTAFAIIGGIVGLVVFACVMLFCALIDDVNKDMPIKPDNTLRAASATFDPRLPIIGIYEAPLPADRAKALGYPVGAGILVTGVVSNSRAAAAGIRTGDVISEIGGNYDTYAGMSAKYPMDVTWGRRNTNYATVLPFAITRNGKAYWANVNVSGISRH